MEGIAMSFNFTGDFEILPFRAGILFGSVPTNPTAADFHRAVSDLEINKTDAAAHWRLEAIRERRMTPGVALVGETLRAVNRRVAKRLFDLRAEKTAR
jgi:hypothetical protein